MPAVNLPSGCFCSSGPSPTPYLPLTDLLALLAKKGVNQTQVSVETKVFTTWHVKADNIDLKATFINGLNQSMDGLKPFSLSVRHNESNPNYFSERDLSCGNVRLDYTVTKWQSPSPTIMSTETDEQTSKQEQQAPDTSHSFELQPAQNGGASIRNDWTIAPEGVFCQRPDIYRKKLPDIPDHFSVKIETVDEVCLHFISAGPTYPNCFCLLSASQFSARSASNSTVVVFHVFFYFFSLVVLVCYGLCSHIFFLITGPESCNFLRGIL